MEKTRNFNSGYFLAILTTMIWGISYIGSRIAFACFSPIEVGVCRIIIGTIGLFVLAKFIMKTSLKINLVDLPMFFLIGGLGYFVSILLTMYATNYAGSTLASLLNSTNPIAISFFAALILREKITLKQVFLLAAAMVGVMIVCSGDISGGTLLGVFLCIGAVLTWAVATNYNKKMTFRYPPIVITFWSMLCSLAFNIPTLAISTAINGLPSPTLEGILAILFLGIVSTCVAHGLWSIAMSKLPATTCSMFYPLQPLTSAVVAVLLFGDVLTWRLIVGGIVILAAILLNIVNFPKKK